MISLEQVTSNKVQITIDTREFNNAAITKALHLIPRNYEIFWNSCSKNIQTIIIERKRGQISEEKFTELRDQLNQGFKSLKTGI
jgi:hypothetical protein